MGVFALRVFALRVFALRVFVLRRKSQLSVLKKLGFSHQCGHAH